MSGEFADILSLGTMLKEEEEQETRPRSATSGEASPQKSQTKRKRQKKGINEETKDQVTREAESLKSLKSLLEGTFDSQRKSQDSKTKELEQREKQVIYVSICIHMQN